MINRTIIIVLDSLGIGELPDADKYGDIGANTLGHIYEMAKPKLSNMKKLGLYNIDGLEIPDKEENIIGNFGKAKEKSEGKNSPVGHWEIAGIVSKAPLPTYPNGFPKAVIEEFKKRTNRGVLCNKPYSGTDVIRDYGEKHLQTGDLIVYTSADSVFQVAAHEKIVPVEKLYEYCKIAREILITYCPFAKPIREELKGNPMYESALHRLDLLNAKTVQRIQGVYDKYQKAGGRITQELTDNLEYYEL